MVKKTLIAILAAGCLVSCAPKGEYVINKTNQKAYVKEGYIISEKRCYSYERLKISEDVKEDGI